MRCIDKKYYVTSRQTSENQKVDKVYANKERRVPTRYAAVRPVAERLRRWQ